MSARPERPTRERILRAAVRLFQERGYAAVGVNDVLDAARAPKGSLYHHFPAGKEQLAIEAIGWLSREVEDGLAHCRACKMTGAQTILALGAAMEGWLERSSYRQGCLIAALSQEVIPTAPAIHAAIATAYREWGAALSSVLVEDGWPEAEAVSLAQCAIAAAEGGLILARVAQNPAPLQDTVRRVAALAARA